LVQESASGIGAASIAIIARGTSQSQKFPKMLDTLKS
jgi:hypothetical protein